MISSRRGSATAGVVVAVLMVVVVLGVAAMLFYRSTLPPELAPSEGFAIETVPMPPPLSSVVAPPSGAEGDGGEDVAPVIERFLANTADVDAMIKARYTAKESSADPLPFTSAAELLAAADKKEFKYLEKHWPASNVEWRDPVKLMRMLSAVYRAAILEGRQAAKAGDAAKAEAIYRAVLIYGYNLTNTHIRVWFQLTGLDAQKAGARELASLWGTAQPAKAKAAMTYGLAAASAWGQLNTMHSALIKPVNKWKAGNLIYVVRNHPDRAWQVDALLALGMARLNQPERDKPILAFLNKYAANSDPYLAAAAKWSINLTAPEFNLQGRPELD